MILTAILNAILALGVIIMVVTPLVWAILTQHRDHPELEATDGATATSPSPLRRRTPQPSYKPIIPRV